MRRRLLTATALAALVGCAPRLATRPEITVDERAVRYRADLAERQAPDNMVDASLVVWTELGERRLPGVEAQLLLAAPDAFRLRVGSVFGTALDLGARGDSVVAYVPARRTATRLDAARDSLGLVRPGALGFRALAAAWDPPPPAWEAGALEQDSLWRVTWLEDGDTLRVAVGTSGLPAWASLTRPGKPSVRAAYTGWNRAHEVAWPDVVEIEEDGGRVHVQYRVSRVRFPDLDPARLAVRIPPGAATLTLEELRDTIERMGAF
jgi:hypothetical protein